MTDEDIDTSDIPELTPEMFARGIVRRELEPVAPTTDPIKARPARDAVI